MNKRKNKKKETKAIWEEIYSKDKYKQQIVPNDTWPIQAWYPMKPTTLEWVGIWVRLSLRVVGWWVMARREVNGCRPVFWKCLRLDVICIVNTSPPPPHLALTVDILVCSPDITCKWTSSWATLTVQRSSDMKRRGG